MLSEDNNKVQLQTQQLLEMKFQSSPIIARIISQTPGRIRFRVFQLSSQDGEIERIASVLKERLEIYRVRTNVQTGSITIFYAREHLDFGQINSLLQNLGVTWGDFTPQQTNGRSQAAVGIIDRVYHLNQRVKIASNDSIDLRFLVPLGFGVLAVRQLLIKGLLLDAIPWYVLAWYAFDSFIKFHYTSEPHSAIQKSE